MYGSIPPGPEHPEYPRDEDKPTACFVCLGDGCEQCAGSGSVPAWCYDPEITGWQGPAPTYRTR